MTASDKRKAAQKEAAKKRPQTWKKGQSGNPTGAPKRGESWREIVKTIGDLTPKEAADYCRAVAGKIAEIGDQVTLKEAVILRVYTALLFEPDARLLNAIMDRDEGKVNQPVTVTWREQAAQQGYDPDQLFTDMVNAARARLVESSGGGSVSGSATADSK